MTGVDDATLDRAVGAVLASATGDALGAGYEFSHQDPDQEIAMIGGGPFAHKWAKGEWTDDTQMAVAILDVIATGSTDLEEIGANFLAWHATNPHDMGNQTRSVLSTADYPEELTAIATAYVDANERSAGNGGLMRTAPVALADLDDRVEIAQLAESIASLTHAHPDSVAACVLWSLAIQEAITTAEPDQAFDWEAAIRNGLEHVAEDRQEKWDALITEAVIGPPAVFKEKNGWVVKAFQAALSAIVNTVEPEEQPADHLRDALIAAVRIGNDTDTVAAIAGGLLGARWGKAAIPEEWLSLVHGDRRRGSTQITAGDLEELARGALQPEH